ncbi:hypothetical protein [Synechococcus sp. GFB01]|uniref:hypothetical protein n=1 Tax=Synechococcus sp. GFB01 TaxID=1662190 RepID=UPI001F369BAD|nr:hypothetical protein [Synechococcus sp. GFB01]
MTLFEQQWATYRAVVEHDLMEHRALGEATAAAIGSWLDRRPAGAASPRLVDLGCGDLARSRRCCAVCRWSPTRRWIWPEPCWAWPGSRSGRCPIPALAGGGSAGLDPAGRGADRPAACGLLHPPSQRP